MAGAKRSVPNGQRSHPASSSSTSTGWPRRTPKCRPVGLIRRLGSELMVEPGQDGEVVDFSPLVPPDYLISPGDEIVLSIWGSVDAELRLFVDRSGRITVPRVGSIMVSGVRYADLPETIRLARGADLQELPAQCVARPVARRARVCHRFRGAPRRLHGERAVRHGQCAGARRRTVGIGQLPRHPIAPWRQAGVPTRLLRPAAQRQPQGRPVGTGRRRAARRPDRPAGRRHRQRQPRRHLRAQAQRDDGRRTAHGRRLLGRGRHHAPGAGTRRRARDRARGADRHGAGRQDRAAQRRCVAGLQCRDLRHPAAAAEQAGPRRRRSDAPGRLPDAGQQQHCRCAAAAGGFTPGAFVFGTDFTRESVRLSQQENYERALRNLETDIALATSTQRITIADEAAAVSGRSA